MQSYVFSFIKRANWTIVFTSEAEHNVGKDKLLI